MLTLPRFFRLCNPLPFHILQKEQSQKIFNQASKDLDEARKAEKELAARRASPASQTRRCVRVRRVPSVHATAPDATSTLTIELVRRDEMTALASSSISWQWFTSPVFCTSTSTRRVPSAAENSESVGCQNASPEYAHWMSCASPFSSPAIHVYVGRIHVGGPALGA